MASTGHGVARGHDNTDFYPLLGGEDCTSPSFSGNGHAYPTAIEPCLETILDTEEIATSIMTRFRCSGFLQSVVEYVDTRQKSIQSNLEKQLNQLRSEKVCLIEQLRGSSADVPLNVPDTILGTPSQGFQLAPTVQSAEVFAFEAAGDCKFSEGERQLAAMIRAQRQSLINTSGSKGTLKTASSVPATDVDVASTLRSECSSPSARDANQSKRKHGGVNLGGISVLRTSKASSIRSVHRDGVFADIETMKAEIRTAIFRKPYNVAQYYKTQGVCQMVARSALFEYVTLLVILANSIWIAIDVDMNTATSINQADFGFQFAEYFFFAFFCTEWAIRFGAFRLKRDCLNDWWFIFDSGLVAMMIADHVGIQVAEALSDQDLKDQARGDTNAAIMRMLRLTKLTRMARMAKLLRAIPELTILVKGIWVAARSVLFTLCLLAILIYIFSVAFRQLTDSTPVGDKYFPSVPYGMKSLLLYGTLPDFYPMVEDVGAEHIVLGILLLFFILLGSLTVMNMLVGVLVEVVSVVSAVEKEELKVNFVKAQLLGIMQRNGMDAHEEMVLSREEFEFLFLKQGAAKVFNDIGVDPVGFVDTSAYIFKEAGSRGVTFRQFIELVLSMRGTNTATVKDMVDLRRVLLEKMEVLEMYIRDLRLPVQRNFEQRLSPPGNGMRATLRSDTEGASSFHSMHSGVSTFVFKSRDEVVESQKALSAIITNDSVNPVVSIN